MDEKIVEHHLGPETDRDLLRRLVHAVQAAGGDILQVYSGVAGEHRIALHEIFVGGSMLTMRTESGSGLILSGPESAVRRLSQLVRGESTIW